MRFQSLPRLSGLYLTILAVRKCLEVSKQVSPASAEDHFLSPILSVTYVLSCHHLLCI